MSETKITRKMIIEMGEKIEKERLEEQQKYGGELKPVSGYAIFKAYEKTGNRDSIRKKWDEYVQERERSATQNTNALPPDVKIQEEQVVAQFKNAVAEIYNICQENEGKKQEFQFKKLMEKQLLHEQEVYELGDALDNSENKVREYTNDNELLKNELEQIRGKNEQISEQDKLKNEEIKKLQSEILALTAEVSRLTVLNETTQEG